MVRGANRGPLDNSSEAFCNTYLPPRGPSRSGRLRYAGSMKLHRILVTGASLALALSAVACGGNGSSGSDGGSTSTAGSGGTTSGSGGSSGGTGGNTMTDTFGGGGSGGNMPVAVCDAPFGPVDTSQPTTVVGTGTGTCTEEALDAAIAKGGIITFDCGGAATIAVTHQKELPKDKDTTIDGGGLVTLDGGSQTRIFHFDGGDFRKTTKVVTLQHLTIKNAKSTGTKIPDAPPPCSQGTDVDGGGAAILIRDGVLHVIDVTFEGGQAAPLGPDVAGGGVYGIGSLDVSIVGSRFLGNTASNGGAVGSLFSNLTLVNDVFDANKALGEGANYIDPACGVNGGESGNGGNGGAVVMDGGESFDVTICGCTFTGNSGNALGGAVFRTPDIGVAPTHIDRSTFDGNQCKSGGAAYFHHSTLVITATTFSNNTATKGSGAIQSDDTDLQIENSTFWNNSALEGLGGAISLFGNHGSLTNVTFANNHADGGSGLFGAALAGNTAFDVNNSVFANNTSMDCGAPMACHANGSGQGDLQWPDKHIVCDNADPPCGGQAGTTFADPMLGQLADNGGPTKTVAPAANSPAAGLGKGCPKTDQRGNPRKADGCTAGAFELP